MRQSTVIFGTLLLAFIVYITLRDQLPEYLALFKGKSKTAAPSTTAQPSAPASSKVDPGNALMNGVISAMFDKAFT